MCHRVYVELYKMPQNSFLSGCRHPHAHQIYEVHISFLLALSAVSPRSCKHFGVYSVVSFMVLVCMHFLGKYWH